jgi:membrane protease YdiL (CAAX protease family)
VPSASRGCAGGLAVLIGRELIALPVPTDLLRLVGGLGPLLAAVGVAARRSGRAGVRALLVQLLRWRVGAVCYAVALLVWLAVNFGLILLNLAAGGGPYEEVGWRGVALPRLQERYGALAASLLLGLVWAIWHLPLWPEPRQAMPPFVRFVPNVVALSVVLAWLYNGTRGCLLIVALAHTANNVAFRVYRVARAAGPRHRPRPRSGLVPPAPRTSRTPAARATAGRPRRRRRAGDGKRASQPHVAGRRPLASGGVIPPRPGQAFASTPRCPPSAVAAVVKRGGSRGLCGWSPPPWRCSFERHAAHPD